MKFLLTGGGTGGHVFPALATAEVLKREGHTVLFVGTRHGLEARAVPAAGYIILFLPSRPIGRKISPGTLWSFGVMGAGVVRAYRLLAKERPAAVLSTGGYAGAALAAAGVLRGTPVLLFEPNAIPGRTTRLLARWASGIAVAYASCAPHFGGKAAPVVVTGTPVRPGIGKEDKHTSRRCLGLDAERFTLLVVGGSTGARSLNQTVVAAAPALLQDGVQILHQTGHASYPDVQAATSHLARPLGSEAPPEDGKRRYVITPFLDRMDQAYAAADVVLCRAGASTLAEVTTVGLPAILVPYPYAVDDHQTHNAKALVEAGAGVLIPNAELTPQRLTEVVRYWLHHPEERTRASEASRRLARPDAAEQVAHLLKKIGGGGTTD